MQSRHYCSVTRPAMAWHGVATLRSGSGERLEKR